MAHVVRKHWRRVARPSIRWRAQRSSNRNIHNQKEWIGRAAERPCVAGGQVGRSHDKIRLRRIVNVILNHVRRPDLAVRVKRSIDPLAGRKDKGSTSAAPPCTSCVNG